MGVTDALERAATRYNDAVIVLGRRRLLDFLHYCAYHVRDRQVRMRRSVMRGGIQHPECVVAPLTLDFVAEYRHSRAGAVRAVRWQSVFAGGRCFWFRISFTRDNV